MQKSIRYVGLDVHADTIAVAVAETGGEVRSVGTIPNTADAVRKLIKRLGAEKDLRVCYEAGPTGYVLYWQLTQLGVSCEVIAPTLVPVKAGDRVKTDRRDAQKLARCYRAGDLTPVWVPDAAHEALRDLVRAREAAKKDQTRARHRLGKMLLRQGRRSSLRAWTVTHMDWARRQKFEQPAQQAAFLDYVNEVDHAAERLKRLETALDAAVEAAPPRMRAVIEGLQALRGIAKLTAVTVVAEVGSLSRFEHPRQLMGYSGAVPSEYSTGQREHKGAITKTGNAHLRRGPHRGGVDVSTWATSVRLAEEATGKLGAGDQGDRLEGASAAVRPLSAVLCQGQARAQGRHGSGPRAPGIHVGHRQPR